ncbi:MAG: methyltransferase [Deltaproteobacteria bacterium RIFCSPLOWO2_12_FULL_43_16]|nr:MAG: methyltransferase [Deltaproteobacteria bacterium GWA2_43_19]OGQ11565.1 MAG: methyltransferase [Deltaproteobacteria bacterium RIFCSPHIGHO2_02_FULL_43_33]OGQ39149.1 MAG: methyltransferase [Deltaproteobacteria bacterium RIFCSPLOWO2_01_FULL_42_9]OGQ59450.1 MAG: methyltransferase [Deltaproteobacteria bacterium RIFCSPLOWO2_12_FULL_43_16]HBR18347.1 site-specific DNA-methyltransferase [Deltaproteobacteria bacterium]
MNGEHLNKIIHGDSLQILSGFDDNSIDLVLTDPPYFLDKMDNGWDEKKVASTKYHHVVKSLPAGMKFDREQGKNFYEWYYKISKQVLRVLKPGGFFFSFSSPRLYHRMVSAIDDAGFLIRDCFIWLYTQNQPKAMSLNHFIDKLNESERAKTNLKKQLNGWKTPQIKSCFEPIVMAQKEPEGTFLENFRKYHVGLLNTQVKIGQDMFPANVVSTDAINEVVDKCFLISKPDKKEKGDFNAHRTVKPLSLCEYIINLTTYSPESVVLDPFAGSGTTLVAAKKLGRKFIGIDINKEYIAIAKTRLNSLEEDTVPYDAIGAEKQLRIFEKQAKYKRLYKAKIPKAV